MHTAESHTVHRCRTCGGALCSGIFGAPFCPVNAISVADTAIDADGWDAPADEPAPYTAEGEAAKAIRAQIVNVAARLAAADEAGDFSTVDALSDDLDALAIALAAEVGQ